jgi:geranylgeranyl diphosphate synthase type I
LKQLEFLSAYTEVVEEEMEALFQAHPKFKSFYGMMRYHLGWADERLLPTRVQAGKRLRPALCLLVCEASGGDYESALPAAAALELVHNFSLVHDDVEDGSPKRRGRPTLWSLWGMPQAVNTGDGLLALAHLALLRLPERGVDSRVAVEAIAILDEASLRLCEGQYLDLSFEESQDVTVQMYLEMAERKTASLLVCAAHLGSLLAGADERIKEGYRCFAHHLGLAFQITDDILGLWGQESATGKGVGEDIVSKKKSLPVVCGLEEARKRGLKELQEIYCKETLSPKDVSAVLTLMAQLGVRDYAEALAQEHTTKALAELETMGVDNQAQGHLKDLALYLTQRRA